MRSRFGDFHDLVINYIKVDTLFAFLSGVKTKTNSTLILTTCII